MKNAKWVSALSFLTFTLGFLGCADQSQNSEATELGNTTVSGHVLADGKPVEGATVYLHLGKDLNDSSMSGIASTIGIMQVDSTVTDEDGYYDFGMVKDYFFLETGSVSYLPTTDAPKQMNLHLENEESINWEVFYVWIENLHEYDPSATEDILVSVNGGWVDLYGILPHAEADYPYKVVGKIHGKLYLVESGVYEYKLNQGDYGIDLPEGYSTVKSQVVVVPWVREAFADSRCAMKDLSVRLYSEKDGQPDGMKVIPVLDDGTFEISNVSDGYYLAQVVGCKGFGSGQWYYMGDGSSGGETVRDAEWAKKHRTLYLHKLRTETYVFNREPIGPDVPDSLISIYYADGEWERKGDTLWLQDYGDMDEWADSVVQYWVNREDTVVTNDAFLEMFEEYGGIDRKLTADIRYEDGSAGGIYPVIESRLNEFIWHNDPDCSVIYCFAE